MANPVENEYLRHLDERGPIFGMQQCAQLVEGILSMLRLQILREQPDMTPSALKLETARRFYFGDAAAQHLLNLAAQHNE